jgi:hypothetical protein
MDSSKLAVKLFIENPSDLKSDEFVPVFHRWIQTRALDEHQLIDVADYRHVHQGPGTVLVSHEANIHADLGDGRLGLLYIRKAPLSGSFQNRLRAVLGYALKAATMLEADPALGSRVKFGTNELVLEVNDRLLAPNTPETFQQLKSELESFFAKLYGTSSIQLSQNTNPQRLFAVDIRIAQTVPLATLLDRLA